MQFSNQTSRFLYILGPFLIACITLNESFSQIQTIALRNRMGNERLTRQHDLFYTWWVAVSVKKLMWLNYRKYVANIGGNTIFYCLHNPHRS